MQAPTALHDVRLVPVLELEPGRFARTERQWPSRPSREAPHEWDRYWRDCLADAGVVALTPLRPGSWHVPTRALADPKAADPKQAWRILEATVRDWGGPDSLTGPDANPVFCGGLALCDGG